MHCPRRSRSSWCRPACGERSPSSRKVRRASGAARMRRSGWSTSRPTTRRASPPPSNRGSRAQAMLKRLLPWSLLTAVLLSPAAVAGDVVARPLIPADVSVTVYRDPNQLQSGEAKSLALDDLGGFALVSETRTVSVPAGESRIRFEGVADGIDAASALITGLPNGVLEKNRDARVMSPSALVAATVGKTVTLVRANKKTGQTTRVAGKILSDADGVVFESTDGAIEALRCSGLSETFEFEPVTDLTPTPTLSALVRTPRAFTAQVKLSYLTRGFDWQATYTATLAADGKTMDLGAWVTLANSNSTSFANAHAQVVAGRLNRESGEVEPVDWGHQIVAQCWPRGSTSDTPAHPHIERAEPIWDGPGGYWVVMDSPRKAM